MYMWMHRTIKDVPCVSFYQSIVWYMYTGWFIKSAYLDKSFEVLFLFQTDRTNHLKKGNGHFIACQISGKRLVEHLWWIIRYFIHMHIFIQFAYNVVQIPGTRTIKWVFGWSETSSKNIPPLSLYHSTYVGLHGCWKYVPNWYWNYIRQRSCFLIISSQQHFILILVSCELLYQPWNSSRSIPPMHRYDLASLTF